MKGMKRMTKKTMKTKPKLSKKLFAIFSFAAIMAVAVFTYAGTPVTQEKAILAYTQTALGSDASYTGSWIYVGDYGRITLMVISNQDSAANGVKIQQTGDAGCNVSGATPNADYVSSYSYTASTGAAYSVEVVGRCARIVYTNGSSGQTTFRLFSSLKTY